ncbi:MAG TPA: plasmid pRiA4b ORF-3 family protein [Gemmataceae bacterium]|nr:plasmid pRiA4b ORF-3 family protein [Gemmataceae bacterium]
MNDLLTPISARLQPRVREIVDLTDAFCRAHLDDEYRELCRQVVIAAAEADLPLASGKAAGWAAGVMAAVGFANFLGDPSQPFHMTTEQMARKIGVSPATLHTKSKAIRNALDVMRFDPRFATRTMTDQSPFTWILTVNGVLMDIRAAPRAAQEEALRLGLIPYLPADRGQPGRVAEEPHAARKRKSAGRSRRSAARAGAGVARVYTLDVSLLQGPVTRKFVKKNKSVVRTIQIRGDQTLEDLHEAIFDAFDRFDPHMYEFQMGNGPMDPEGPRYVLPMEAGDEDFGPRILGTVAQTTIDSMGLEVGRQFGYWFDFGDDWHHQIGVARIDPGPGEEEYPRVVKRIGESPPQYAE